MKKQIFKLTSILLAMVMVFTMFTIVPISAEEATVNLSDAVANLKTAWKNLDYANTTEECGVNYAAGWIGEIVDEKTVTFAADTAQLLMWGTQTDSSNMNDLKLFENKISDIEDIYFYYSSTGDVTTLSKSVLNNGVDAFRERNFESTSTVVLENTNGEMRKVYLSNYLASVNSTSNIYNIYVKDFAGAYDYFLRWGFEATAAEGTTLTLGKIYAEVDENLYGTDSLTDVQWFDKVAAVDLATLKADYEDAEDSAKWQAFLAAREAVLACSVEAAEARLRAAAEEMITSETSYAYPVGIGRTPKAYVLNSKNPDMYGDYYLTETITGNATLNTAATSGIWLTNNDPATETTNNRVGDANLRFGDYGDNPYFVIKVNSITGAGSANIGFWGRYNGTPIGGSNKDYASNYKVSVVAGGEYKVYIDDVLSDMNSGDDTYNANFADWKNISTQALAGTSGASFNASIFSVMTQDAGVTVNMTVGSIVDASNYKITSESTGAQFVAEMATLDITKFGNTDAFEAALATARAEFPEAEQIIVVEKLRVAAGKMTTYGASILYPNKYWVTGRAATDMVDSESAAYGDKTATYTVPNVGTMASSTVTGLWLTNPLEATASEANRMLDVSGAGDAYITIKVNSITDADTADLRFRYRANSTGINQLLSFTLPVVAGGEYTFSLTQLFEGSTAADWKTFFGTTNFNFLVIAAEGAEANITVGSAVYKSNYAPSSATGVDFVAAMKALKASDEYAAFSNTAEFEAALTAAIAAFPELEAAEAKQAALSSLRTAWKAMLEEPVINSNYYHYGFWNASSTKTNPATTSTDHGTAITVTGIETTATEYGGVDGNPTANLLLYQTNTTVNFGTAVDFGFWYKSTGDINVRSYLMYGASPYADSAAATVLNGDGEWHFYSMRTVMGETAWAAMSNRKDQNLYRFYIDLGNVVDDVLTSVDVTFGGVGFCYEDTTVAAIEDDDLVAQAITVNTDNYKDTTAFKAALTAALEFYPELKAEYEKAKAIPALSAAWKAMTYIPQKVNTAPVGAYSTGGSSATAAIFNESMADARNSYIDPEITGYGTAFKFPAVDFKDSNGASTSYEWFIWRNNNAKLFSKSDIEYIGFWYNSSVAITPVRILFNGGNQVDGGTLPATDGWKFITLKEIMGETNWNNKVLNNAAISDVSEIRMMFTHGTQRTTEIYFGDLEIYSKDTQIIDIDNLSATALIKKADATNLGVYENGAAKDAFVAALEAAKTYYATELEAAAIKDAALTLNNELFMKPISTISPWREEDEANSGVESKTVFGTSNNGDYYTTVNTAVIGNASCAPDTGAVMYETDTPVLLKDIEDITFSYKVENKNDNVLTVARIWFYEENYTRYEKDEEGNIVYEEDDVTPVVDRNNWQCGMEAYGDTRYLAFNANTDGWVETSLATIFGDDWKTVYLGYLNGSDINEVDFTEENTYISKMSFGFNTKDGASADVSVGSMYIKKTDASAYTITADDADFEGVLAEARAINLDNVNIAKANEFKKLVKAFETKIGAEVKAGYIAGNWYEDGLTLKDLSVLSRKNDSTLGDTFCDDDAIGDLTEESIRKSLLGIQ